MSASDAFQLIGWWLVCGRAVWIAGLAVFLTRGSASNSGSVACGGPCAPRRSLAGALCGAIESRRWKSRRLSGFTSTGLSTPRPALREIFELGADGRYTRAIGATEGLVGEVPGCPGLSLNLSDLWAETDRLGHDEVPPAASS